MLASQIQIDPVRWNVGSARTETTTLTRLTENKQTSELIQRLVYLEVVHNLCASRQVNERLLSELLDPELA